MGSGTIGGVCDKLERSFVGYDLKNYYTGKHKKLSMRN